MTSKRFCCNRTILKRNFAKCWPLWALFTVALLLTFSLRFMRPDGFFDIDEIVSFYIYAGVFLLLPYAVLCASFSFAYLHNTRSAYMLHAFPVTRDRLYGANLLSGLLFFLVPLAGVTALNMPCIATTGVISGYGVAEVMRATLFGSGLFVLEYLFYYGLAVLCMHITGNTIYSVLIYFTTNFLTLLVDWLVRVLVEPLLYGCDIAATGSLAMKFSPSITYIMLGEEIDAGGDASAAIYFGVLAALGVLFALAAWGLYRRRRLESCGEAIAFPFLRPVFQYLLTLLASLTIGILTAVLAFNDAYLDGNLIPTLGCLLFGGFVGFFGAEMMLRRSRHVFKKRAWIGFLCFAAVATLGLTAVHRDWFGLISYVPETDEIASVELYERYSGSVPSLWLTEEAEIEEMREIHAMITQDYLENGASDTWHEDDIYLQLNYYLKNGEVVERYYTVRTTDAAYARLRAVVADPDRNCAAVETAFGSNVTEASVYWYGKFDETQTSANIGLNAEQQAALKEAMCHDIQAGRFYCFGSLYSTGEMVAEIWIGHDRNAEQSPESQIRVAYDTYISLYESATETYELVQSWVADEIE